uniref:NADH dehydrogenase subunit 4L n=1 Tax=Cyrtarachne nagasakiensis TaxID=386110 RepID=A0A0U2JRH6_9ARAC|nr:NADH dehydrogenase subunit 4L [Cyrtarachne nagasakiensis]ALF36383.1 NADH dehydrogenase subunit 4L [Cyrtarachne nagasakiensis]
MHFIKILIIISIISLWWWRKNILIILLNFEFMILSIFTLISLKINFISSLSLMIMLTIMVAGSSLGLTLMVSLCRFFKSSESLPIWMNI